MNTEPRFPRRALLLGALGVGASLFARAPGWPFIASGRPVTAKRLIGLLTDPHSAAALGASYLHAVPKEASARVLTSLLVHSLSRHNVSPELLSDEQLRECVRGASTNDFDQERIFELEGWILARTEARLCALAAAMRF
jgi:hypothetical protein